MRTYSATLEHVRFDVPKATVTRAETSIIDDVHWTLFMCIPTCRRSFRVRIRTRRELWMLRLRRFLLGVGLTLVGGCIALAGGTIGQFMAVVGAVVALPFCMGATVIWCRMFLRSNTYIITDEEGRHAHRDEHRISFE